MDDRAKHEFFRLGTQYWVSGLYAVDAGLLPVCGNLLHHAIEMYLKGVLSKTHPLSELKNKYRDHDLNKMWSGVKAQETDTVLNEYDPTIAELNAFEDLRYPDAVLETGMLCTVDFGNRIPNENGGIVRKEPIYRFHIERVDSLVQVLFKKASLNPKAFVPIGSAARKYLTEPSIAVAFN